MPSALKTTTAALTYDEPSIFVIGAVAYETKGGVTVLPEWTIRQIEVDGVTQDHEGLDFVEKTSLSITCNLVAASTATLQLLMYNDTPTGTAPVQEWQTPPVNRLLASGSYISDVRVMRRRRDGEFYGYVVPRARFTTPPVPSAGISGDGTWAISILAVVPSASSNYTPTWSFFGTNVVPAGVSE
jgi:hypothetical protein